MDNNMTEIKKGQKVRDAVRNALGVKTVRYEFIGYTGPNGRNQVWAWTGGKKTIYQVGTASTDYLTNNKPELI